jgi:hypothetical protein
MICSVCMIQYLDAVPTIFNVPLHLQKIVKKRKPPKPRNSEPQSSVTLATMSTSVAGDLPDLPQIAVKQQQRKLRGMNKEHSYAVLSPTKVKKRLDVASDGFYMCSKRLKLASQRNRRLSQKVESLQDALKEMQRRELLSQQGVENIFSSFDGSVFELIKRCIDKQSSATSRNPYPPQLKAFALTLQFYSARAYDFVRETFRGCLPHPKTLQNWYSCINGSPGFHDEIFAALCYKALETPGGKLTCSFMMDEVAIRKQLDFDRTTDKFVGYIDMGVDLDDMAGLPLANEALVFMLVSLTDNWKVPVAYFLVAGLNGSERANLVSLCLQKLHDVGVNVVSLTFDGCSANIAMATTLGASVNVNDVKPSFPHPSDPTMRVCVMLDACHMLKLIRNTLADKHTLMDCDGNLVKWEFIKKLQELQSAEGLRAANKLHERHIQWAKQKMKVKLAAQTLSASVADALLFCDRELKLPEFHNCAATVRFIRIIDRLFDLMNSRNPVAKGYKSPMKPENEHCWRPFLNEAIKYLQGLKLPTGELLTSTKRKTGVIGFILTARSLQEMFDSLVKNKGLLKYLLTYKFSQDHLELFFASVRARGGKNNNPSAAQLKATWKRLLTHHQLKDISSGNCQPQDTCKLLSIARSVSRMENTAGLDVTTVSHLRRNDGVVENLNCLITDHDYVPNFDRLSSFVDNIIVYIAGFVARSLSKKLSCDSCRLAVTAPKFTDDVYGTDYSLLQLKDRGGLCMPSDDVVAVCRVAEHCIRRVTASNHRILLSTDVSVRLLGDVLSELIGTTIFDSLTDHGLESEPENNHQVSLMKLTAKEYVNLRLYHQCKVVTRFVQGENCRSVLSKTVLFKGQ